MTHYLERDWCRDRLIRNRALERACTLIVGWWPHEDRYRIAKGLQRDLGLNDAEFIEIRQRGRVLDDIGVIDHSDEALGRYLDTINAAHEIAVQPPHLAPIVADMVIKEYELDCDETFFERVIEIAIFFSWNPTPWMIEYFEGREERRAWRAARAAAR